MSITHFIAMEVAHVIDTIFGLGRFTALRKGSLISVLRVEVIVDVTLEVFGAMEPGSCADEGAP